MISARLILGILFSFSVLYGQNSVFDLNDKVWEASWIKHPESNGHEYEVLHFRNSFELADLIDHLFIDISGDSRYRLFVNGHPVCFGPAGSDLRHWNYETVDIASLLKKGRNVLAVQVWNYGKFRSSLHFSYHTGLILRTQSSEFSYLNSGNSGWRVFRNLAYSPNNFLGVPEGIYKAIGTADKINGALFPFGWNKIQYDDSEWNKAVAFEMGLDPGYIYGGGERFLVPRDIPLLEEKREEIRKVRRIAGLMDTMHSAVFPINIPPETQASILFDLEYLTNGYPELVLSKGKDAIVELTYNESLYKNHQSNEKGNRDSVEGKYMYGYTDIIEHHGTDSALYRPLWNRTFRYVQMDVRTGQESLVINDFYNIFTAYPFKENAFFKSPDQGLQEIWDVSWRTARLCAMESYMDCPYWEQLQYIGDTRIQALVSMYVSGDDRLVRRALKQFNNSRLPDGLTLSRYPATVPQIIPTFSLLWISMIHDYFMLRQDDLFLKEFLPGIRSVLSYFDARHSVDETFNIDPGWWCFVDWASGYTRGVPHGSHNGTSSIIALQYVHALQKAAEIVEYFGSNQEASVYRESADSLQKAIWLQCFDTERSLLAQTPEKQVFSQHANILGVLTNTIPENIQEELMLKVLSDSSLVQATIYFKFYLFRALKKSGLGDLYLDQLEPWSEAIRNGLTTFPETPEPSRSDCHAWSASPNYDFLSTICGIEPASQGFRSVSIQPNLAYLESISGKMPHPSGEIFVNLTRKGNRIRGVVTLPEGVEGEFLWKGKKLELSEGENQINTKSIYSNIL